METIADQVIFQWRQVKDCTPFSRFFPDQGIKNAITQISKETELSVSDWSTAFNKLLELRGAMLSGRIDIRSLCKKDKHGMWRIIALLEGKYDRWTTAVEIETISLAEIISGKVPVDYLNPPLSTQTTFSNSVKNRYCEQILRNASWNVSWIGRFVGGELSPMEHRFFKKMSGLIDPLATLIKP